MTSTVIVTAHAGTNLECVVQVQHVSDTLDSLPPNQIIVPNGESYTAHVHSTLSVQVFERPVTPKEE